jgi:two-component system chemotaxis sensor kinase CheA
MVQIDEAFLKKLLAAFTVEAREHLEEITAGLRELQTGDESVRAKRLESIFREMHSLKGAARAVNKRSIETVCQAVESLFSHLQKVQRVPPDNAWNILYRATDLIETDLENQDGVSQNEVDEVIATLEKIGYGNCDVIPAGKKDPAIVKPESAEKTESAATPVVPRKQESLRVSQERLEQVMRESEELLAFKLNANHRVEELEQLSKTINDWKKTWGGIAPVMRQLNQSGVAGETLKANLVRLRQYLEQIQDGLDPLELQMTAASHHARQDATTVSRSVDSLHEGLRDLLMMPFSGALSMLHKTVRDLSAEQNKQVELKITGGDVEADRRILEGMKDPLLHLIRNSIDHGIETTEERIAAGKPPQGTVSIAISQPDAGKVLITIEDDGRGLNLERIRQALVDQKLESSEDAKTMDATRLAASIFLSGLSTSQKVTEISGRGMGMSVVRERVESFNGQVAVVPRKPCGTAFSIILPVTVAAFRGILVKAGTRQFVLPTPAVERMVRIPISEVKTVESRNTITVAGKVLPLELLTGLLELPPAEHATEKNDLLALILCAGGQRFALEVDEVLREQEVLVKGLGSQLVRVRNISGIALLGPGELAPILNVHDLMKSSIRGGSRPATATPAATGKKKKSIMIAEDSITSRMLLKNVLESVGYHVESTVDGAAALAELKTGNFDALVSDVDMPRMNGFVLTERVRADRKLANLPVILVTSLASQEDKERGIEAGASAYIVKSSFDQSNLLSVLDRLLEAE